MMGRLLWRLFLACLVAAIGIGTYVTFVLWITEGGTR